MNNLKVLLLTNFIDHSLLKYINTIEANRDTVVGIVSSLYIPEKNLNIINLVKKYGFLVLAGKVLKRVFKTILPSRVKNDLKKLGVSTMIVKDINSDSSIELIKSLAPDVIFISTFSQIISKEVYYIPKKATINIHASLLPKNRGPAPVFWALLNGDKETGITFHLVNENVDKGDIIAQRSLKISNNDTIDSLELKLSNLANNMLNNVLNDLRANNIKIIQSTYKESYFKRPKKEDWEKLHKMLKERKK